MMSLLNDIAQFVTNFGWLGVTVLIIGGGMWRFYVFRWQYDDKAKEAQFWRDLYLQNAEKVDRALETLGGAITLLQERERTSRR